MDLLKKTIILTSSDVKLGGMGVLTLIKGEGGVFGNFKTYNLKSCSDTVLGIIINGQTFKEKVFINENNNFKFDDNLDINGQVSCVLVEKKQEQINPLIWFSGTKDVNKFSIMNIIYKEELLEKKETKTTVDNENKDQINIKPNEIYKDCGSDIDSNIQCDNLIKSNKILNKDNKTDKNNIEYDNNDNFMQINDKSLSINSLKNNKLKLNESCFEYTEEEIEDEVEKDFEKPFYELIKSQIEDLFEKYPNERFLEGLIENSKWVKIDFENNGRYYVLGLIYQNSTVKYVCYGVPGRFDTLPPKEIEDYNQWIPLNVNNVNGEGYWIMYQDALTGESIKLDVV